MDLFGFFNIFLGIMMILIGMERIKLKKPITKGWKTFFLVAGFILILGGMIKVYLKTSSEI